MENFVEKLREYLETEEGQRDAKEYFGDLSRKDELKHQRFEKLTKLLDNVQFDTLLKRLMDEHTDEYSNRIWNKNIEPYVTNKMEFLFDYVFEKHGEEIEESWEEDYFSTSRYKFKNYYFTMIFGQGVIYRIYDENKKIIFNF